MYIPVLYASSFFCHQKTHMIVIFPFFFFCGGGWYSSNAILVNEAVVQNEDTIVIKCGSEIVPGPDREGQYPFSSVLYTS